MIEFKVGDVVKIKSGGPKMTVCFIDNKFCDCCWFDPMEQLQRNEFSVDIIEPYISPVKKAMIGKKQDNVFGEDFCGKSDKDCWPNLNNQSIDSESIDSTMNLKCAAPMSDYDIFTKWLKYPHEEEMVARLKIQLENAKLQIIANNPCGMMASFDETPSTEESYWPNISNPAGQTRATKMLSEYDALTQDLKYSSEEAHKILLSLHEASKKIEG